MSTRIEKLGYQDYTHNEQSNTFTYDTGVIVLPVASRTAAHRLIRLHGGVGLRVAKWRTDRTGKPPIIPSAQDTSEDTLIGTVLIPSLPTPSSTPDAYDWSVSGQYTYVQDSPRIPGTHNFPVGQSPFPVAGAQRAASDLAKQYGSYYTGSTPFQSFITAIAVNVEFSASFSWPILALPAVLSSDHIIQD